MFKKHVRKFIRFIEPYALAYANQLSYSIIDEFCYNLVLKIPWEWYRENR